MKGPQVKCILLALTVVFMAGSLTRAAYAQAEPTIPAYCSGPGGSVPNATNYCALRAQNVPTIYMCNCQEANEMREDWFYLQTQITLCTLDKPKSQWAACQAAATKQYELDSASASSGAVSCITNIIIPMDEGYPQDCSGGGIDAPGEPPSGVKLDLNKVPDLPHFVRVRQQAPKPQPIPPAPTPVPKSPIT